MLQPIDIDLGEVVEELPEGDYKVRVADAELKTGKTSGNPYLRWQLVVFDHPEAKYNGKAIWHSTPTSGKGAFRLTQFYKAAMAGQKLDTKSTRLDPTQLIGKELRATVVNSHDAEGNATGFTEVKAVRPI